MALRFKIMGSLEEAIASFYKALDVNPNYAGARFNLSLAYLLTGMYGDSWRRQVNNHYKPCLDFDEKLCDGTPVDG